MAKARAYWLIKSEPDCFSIQHLAQCPGQTTCWSGVRNYQARNFMRDGMKVGDHLLFYHSSTDPPAVAGTAVVVREAYPDPTAWDPGDDHFDPKASPDNPIWQMVDVKLDTIFASPLPLAELRSVTGLKDMELLRKGSRLSVQPVKPREYEIILELAKKSARQTPRAPGTTKRPAKSRAHSPKNAPSRH